MNRLYVSRFFSFPPSPLHQSSFIDHWIDVGQIGVQPLFLSGYACALAAITFYQQVIATSEAHSVSRCVLLFSTLLMLRRTTCVRACVRAQFSSLLFQSSASTQQFLRCFSCIIITIIINIKIDNCMYGTMVCVLMSFVCLRST